MEWEKPSTLVAEAELRLIECEKRIKRQRQIILRLERAGADTEEARKLLSHLVDAHKGQELQLKRLRNGLKSKSQ